MRLALKPNVEAICPPGGNSVEGGRGLFFLPVTKGRGEGQRVGPSARGVLASRTIARCGLCLALFVGPGLPAQAEEAAPSEYQLKAAFLYNFGKFVEWPPEAFASSNSAFTIGIIGDNPFGDFLARAVEKKNLNGHPLQVKQFKSLSELKGCHILFVSLSERKRLAEILRAVRGAAVLTVSEIENFLAPGGMIQFYMEGNKVRFAIKDAAAKESGLRISFKLLSLAKPPEGEAKP